MSAGVTTEHGLPYEGRFGAAADLRRLSGRGAMVNVAFQLGLTGLALLRGVAVAGFVTQSDYGLWGLLALALWTALGVRYIGVNEKYVQQSDGDQKLAFQQAFTIELVFAAVACLVLAVFVGVFAALTDHPAMVAPGLTLMLMLPAGALQFPIWAYYRRMDFRALRSLQAVEPLVATAVTVGLAIAGAGYWSFVGGGIAGAWAAALAALRRSAYPLALRYDSRALRTYLRFSLPLAVTGISTLAVFQVIYLVGLGPLGLAGLGAFALAGNVLAFTDRADAVVTDALYPALCAVRDRTSLLFEAFVKSNRLALLWAVPFGVGLSLFASDLVHFALGDRWLTAVGLLQIMGAMTAVHHVGFNWHAFYRARGDTRPIAVSAVLTAATLIAAAIPLMYAHGTTGLGWAFLLAEGVALATRSFYLRRLFHTFRMAAYLTRAMLPAAAVAAALLTVRTFEHGPRTLGLALAELAGYAAVTAALTMLLERPLLREALSYIGWRAQRSA